MDAEEEMERCDVHLLDSSLRRHVSAGGETVGGWAAVGVHTGLSAHLDLNKWTFLQYKHTETTS